MHEKVFNQYCYNTPLEALDTMHLNIPCLSADLLCPTVHTCEAGRMKYSCLYLGSLLPRPIGNSQMIACNGTRDVAKIIANGRRDCEH